MEYSGGISLDTNLRKGQSMGVDVIKSYTEEILAVLEYLHNKDVAHKNLRVGSICQTMYIVLIGVL